MVSGLHALTCLPRALTPAAITREPGEFMVFVEYDKKGLVCKMADCEDGEKFRVIATARVAPLVVVDNRNFNIGSKTTTNNTSTAPGWLEDAPLPRTLAAHVSAVGGGPEEWGRVAEQVYRSPGGVLRGWDRAANCNLNGAGLFRWDVKLSRCLAPSSNHDTPSKPRAGAKKNMFSGLWAALRAHNQAKRDAPGELERALQNPAGQAPSNTPELIVRWLEGVGSPVFPNRRVIEL